MGSFRENFLWAKNRNIFLYGIGNRTRIILDENKDFNIIGLLDRDLDNIGKIINDKKVMDIKEIEKYENVVIIIAASRIYYNVITLRLRNLLDKENVEIYYCTGEKASLPDKKSDNPFGNIKLENLLRKIEKNDVISFDLFDTLIARKTIFPFKVSEICDEIKLAISRDEILKAFNYAKKLNKTILITTDMYLSKKEIEVLLKENNIDSYHELIVSSEINKSKTDGSIYEYILNKYKDKILHIGDNYERDIVMANKWNINTFFIPSVLEMFNKSSISSLISEANNSGNEVVLGLLGTKLFNSPFALTNIDNSVNIDSEEKFGYCMLAPMFFNYIKELVRISLNRKAKNILFFSRDAFLLKELYEKYIEVFNVYNAPKAIYLKISSRLVESASIFNEKDIFDLIERRNFDGNFRDFCKVVFDIDINDLTAFNREKAKDLIKPYINEILIKSEENRKNYLEYLNSLNLSNDTIISDIGYHGSQQYYLEKILNQEFTGYYLLFDVLSIFNNNKMYGLYKFNPEFDSSLKLLEAICVSDEGSYIKALGNNEFLSDKKYKNQYYFNEKVKIIEGIKKYFIDLKNIYENYEKLEDTKEISLEIFNRIFSGDINIDKKISDILYFDTPYSVEKEAKVM